MAVRTVLRRDRILEVTGWAVPTLYKKMADGRFPRGHKMDPRGKLVVWWEDEIEAWQKGEWKSAEVAA